jgi:hypothetical protein
MQSGHKVSPAVVRDLVGIIEGSAGLLTEAHTLHSSSRSRSRHPLDRELLVTCVGSRSSARAGVITGPPPKYILATARRPSADHLRSS